MTATPRADAARNRDRLLATARLMVAAGDLQLQLNDVARRAGMGVGTVYRHFPNRRALVEALADGTFAALVDDAHAASQHDNAWAGVELLLQALLTRQLAEPTLAEVLSTGPDLDATPGTTAHRDEFGQLAQIVLGRARRGGELRPGLTDEDLRHLVCGVVFALRIDDAPQGRVDRYLRVLLDGIRATTPALPAR
ncbi:TetR/AcrR family transcriptional regulator [Dactylosporangium sp. CA-152071]|uniref:TetR/AcrR family transcriptional regulator n=1 Tax=Dactylosporangium sp. CA-152071 TaxID=3239933 RepID=UPI003D8C981B